MANDAGVSDGELVRRTLDGDSAAFGLLYERWHEFVLAFLLKRTRDPEVSMDLMAETFAGALLSIADGPPAIDGSAAPWLLTIARNAMVDSYRRGAVEHAARRRLALDPVAIDDRDIERVLELSAETDMLITLAAQLPAEQFEALRARVLDERDYGDIARQLDCSPAVVRKRVSRAIATLRRATEARA
jgi:RNA polymerase sigma-70 factor (ECF subfamily)